MRILVANLGSTSFKYKLLDLPSGREVASGGFERIGQAGSAYADHAAVIQAMIPTLPQKPQAIGFKAVHGGPISGAVRVTDRVLETMRQFADVAPAHNPAYIAAMEAFAKEMPGVPQVAAFETAFHQTIPAARQTYAIPHEWTEQLGIRRYGFHGASHRYIAERAREVSGGGKRIISCHLGGSSSVCAIEDGKSVANSFGMTAQSGLPHNNRVGDFDAFAMLKLLKTGLSPDEIFRRLSKEGGLLGVSGVSPDLRDIVKAAGEGNARAKLAVDVLIESVKHYVGAYLAALGGIDVLAFTGGIGQNAPAVREGVCRTLGFAGIRLDPALNAGGSPERRISPAGERVQVWILPTNEELIVARQTQAVLAGEK